MKRVIHIFGASGSGTTTLGAALSRRLGFKHMDTDDYYWLPTDPPFTTARLPEERVRLMRQGFEEADKGVVLSGSVGKWIQPLLPEITLAVRLVTATPVRIARLRKRELARFGSRILPGGDMAENHEEFIRWAAQYDDGPITMRSRAMHDQYEQELSCPVLTMSGEDSIEESVKTVLALIQKEEYP